MINLRDELKKTDSGLYAALMKSWEIAEHEWLPAISMEGESYGSLPHFQAVEHWLNQVAEACRPLWEKEGNSSPFGLNSAELYIILASVLFHDIGRAKKIAGKEHGAVSRLILQENWNRLGIVDERLAYEIGLIAEFHTQEPLVWNHHDITRIMPWGTVQTASLAALLVLCDELDTAYNRAIPDYLRLDKARLDIRQELSFKELYELGADQLLTKGFYRNFINSVELDIKSHLIKTTISNGRLPGDYFRTRSGNPPASVAAWEKEMRNHWLIEPFKEQSSEKTHKGYQHITSIFFNYLSFLKKDRQLVSLLANWFYNVQNYKPVKNYNTLAATIQKPEILDMIDNSIYWNRHYHIFDTIQHFEWRCADANMKNLKQYWKDAFQSIKNVLSEEDEGKGDEDSHIQDERGRRKGKYLFAVYKEQDLKNFIVNMYIKLYRLSRGAEILQDKMYSNNDIIQARVRLLSLLLSKLQPNSLDKITTETLSVSDESINKKFSEYPYGKKDLLEDEEITKLRGFFNPLKEKEQYPQTERKQHSWLSLKENIKDISQWYKNSDEAEQVTTSVYFHLIQVAYLLTFVNLEHLINENKECLDLFWQKAVEDDYFQCTESWTYNAYVDNLVLVFHFLVRTIRILLGFNPADYLCGVKPQKDDKRDTTIYSLNCISDAFCAKIVKSKDDDDGRGVVPDTMKLGIDKIKKLDDLNTNLFKCLDHVSRYWRSYMAPEAVDRGRDECLRIDSFELEYACRFIFMGWLGRDIKGKDDKLRDIHGALSRLNIPFRDWRIEYNNQIFNNYWLMEMENTIELEDLKKTFDAMCELWLETPSVNENEQVRMDALAAKLHIPDLDLVRLRVNRVARLLFIYEYAIKKWGKCKEKEAIAKDEKKAKEDCVKETKEKIVFSYEDVIHADLEYDNSNDHSKYLDIDSGHDYWRFSDIVTLLEHKESIEMFFDSLMFPSKVDKAKRLKTARP